MSASNPTPPPTNLIPSLLLLAVSVFASFVFASAFEKAPPYPSDGICGTVPENDAETPDTEPGHGDHGGHGKPDGGTGDGTNKGPAGPQYFAGGLWSNSLGLTSLSELATSLKYSGGSPAVQSISWTGERFVVLDVSPIPAAQISGQQSTQQTTVLTIDHAGADPSPEFGNAIKKHVETLNTPGKIIVLPPLPGKDKVPDSEFPYDWYYLAVEGKDVEIIDWTIVEPKTDIDGFPKSGYLLAWLGVVEGSADLTDKSADELFKSLMQYQDPATPMAVYAELLKRGPYVVAPALNKNEGALSASQALLLHRLMGIHADALIAGSAASDSAATRAAAARAIGELADLTHDPIGKLTLLAEDKSMAVRFEAMNACYKIGGRQAAGVAQLVEAYEMSDAMRSAYESVMPALLASGEPIQPDSRANRLRRMAITELINEERDALVCKILLERNDLPDAKIDEVLKDLAEATGRGPLTALLNLFETMNPQALDQRVVLMKTLAGWAENELDAQSKRLVDLINQGSRPDALHAAAAAALIRATPSHLDAVNAVGLKPVLFKGLAWLSTNQLPKGWPAFAIETALSADPSISVDVRIAALDAISTLPDSAIKTTDVDKLLSLARTADSVDLRFAGIRAINALPDTLKPEDMSDLVLTKLTIRAVPGKLAYDLAKLSVTSGRPVELTLINPDTMPHNLVITTPGSATAIGSQVTSMGPSESAAINYVPQSDAVLHHTRMVPSLSFDTLRFIAPAKPGSYDYVCTFPGHFTTMRGVLEVAAP